jgi:hypothetical protein
MTTQKTLADLSPDEAAQITDEEFAALGGTIVDGGDIEDAPTDYLLAAFHAPSASAGQKAYFASLLVDRGVCCTAPDCAPCDEVRARAEAFKVQLALEREKTKRQS